MENNQNLMDKVISLCKRRGFVFPGSEIYGGLANSWDYGPLGVELKNNLRDWWWRRFVQERNDMVGIDAAILMNPKVWEASGHLESFTDPLVECKRCHHRFREDQLEEAQRQSFDSPPARSGTNTLLPEPVEGRCPDCGGELTEPKKFNLLFQTSVGAVEGDQSTVYLRGEIAQAMFVNFKNILDTTRKRLPFGIASVGKAFRNEITPGNFIYRTLEFDLMEFEYFCEEKDWEKYFEYWLRNQQGWLEDLGFQGRHLRAREHKQEELSHYSKRTVDIEYHTPFGWKELFGLAYRTDFDLKSHMEKSGADLQYTNPDTGEKFIPHVIEPTFGLTRLVLMMLLEFYHEDDQRVILRLHPRLAPYKVAVFPLLANKPNLITLARSIFDDLRPHFMTAWDDRGNIGKRYWAQDEIGTPFCITVDFQSLEDNTVTVRDRDTMKQERISVNELKSYIASRMSSSGLS